MAEVWLRQNRRALALLMLLPAALVPVGVVFALGLWGPSESLWPRVLGAMLIGVGLAAQIPLAIQMCLPRLAYADRHLLVRLRSGPPIRVPIEIVECFWLGQAAALLPGQEDAKTESASIVVRLAERASDWKHVDVKPALGLWCEGYITIRGTWCEPLSIDVVNRLNQRLSEVSVPARTPN